MRGKIAYTVPFLACILFFCLPTPLIEPLHLNLVSLFAFQRAPKALPEQIAGEPFIAWSDTQERERNEALLDAERSIGLQHPFLVANVIFQDQSPWSNSLWVDVGYGSENLPFPITNHCPVLLHDIVIGMIDFVGKKASRVRTISDPSFHLAVRVVRGNRDGSRIVAAVHDLQKAVKKDPNLLPKPELASTLHRLLECIPGSIQAEGELSLAKGELQGAEHPSRPEIFRGIGFNYDFSDAEGDRRDLRSGQQTLVDQRTLLIRPGDLLKTSGLDGVFPRGLRVATVLTVFPLEEGAISYQILATSEAKEFPNFDHLTIIPAQPEEPLHPPSTQETLLHLISEP